MGDLRSIWLGAAMAILSAHAAFAQPAPDLSPTPLTPLTPGPQPGAADPSPSAIDPEPSAPAPVTEPPPVAPLPAPVSPVRSGPPDGTLTDVHDLSTLGLFLGGAAVGFVAHESGHVVTNLAYGNVPTLIYIKPFGFVPFVAISPQVNCTDDVCLKKDGTAFGGGRPGLYVIVTAGFTVQHLTTELLLSLEPGLRYHRAPFRKGVLAFDILVSVGYALASFTNTEDPFGDVTAASRASHINHDIFAALLITPALLDAYRFVRPGSRWVPVVSRTLNATMFGVTFAL